MTEELAKEIKVSRTPVRDALRKLESDGLVTIRAHVGASVKQVDLKEFRELCDLRLALESHAAGLAARNHSEADLHEMKYALNAMERINDQISVTVDDLSLMGELASEDVRFHIAVISAAKNDLMKKEILRLHLINRVVASPTIQPPLEVRSVRDDRRKKVLGMHANIYEAIANSDPAAAKREMEFHLQELIDHNLLLMSRAERGIIARELSPEEMAYGT